VKIICHITPSYPPSSFYGGPIISVSRLCESQARLGEELRVLTTTANGPAELPVPISNQQKVNGVSVYYHRRYTKDHSHLSPGLWWQLWLLLSSTKVIHIHSWWNLVTIPAVCLCRLRGVRPVLSSRGMLSPYTLKSPLKRIFHQIVGHRLLRCTVLHATSEQEAQEALALIPDWPHFILPNIVELPALGAYPPAPGKQQGIRLIFLSRIHPKKGLEALFQALASVDFPWHLQIVGDGTEEYLHHLQALSRDLGIAAQLSWLGWRSGAEKFQLLANADLFVLPSHNENFANVVLEALAVGTPVLLSPEVGLATYVQEKDLGWVAVNTPEHLAAALQVAALDQDKRQWIHHSAPAQVHADFDAQTLAKQYLDAYKSFGLT